MRGVAVLGILAINIALFAGPPTAAYAPTVIGSGAPADAIAFTVNLVVFEGKLRTLFSLLFGASLELFVSRAEKAGNDGQALQLRRLLWLGGFGYLHFLLWWGDILFTYAVAGIAALALRQVPPRALLATALLLFTAWQVNGCADEAPLAIAEARVATGAASAAEREALATSRAAAAQYSADALAGMRRGLIEQVATKLAAQPFAPVRAVVYEFGETLPMMLIGIVLLRSGFFSGGWSRRALTRTAIAGIGIGGVVTAAFAGWALVHQFPFAAMRLVINHALGFPHLLMALGYAALLVGYAQPLLARAPGRLVASAGRMALSNYLATSVVMTAIFDGWGLSLAGRVGSAAQIGFVVLGWVLMLGWSTPWLARFRHGPFEWLWRSLTRQRLMPMRK